MAFIVFEGLDGSGKTTQIHKLADYLREKKSSDVIFTREPGGTPLAEEMRELLLRHDEEVPSPRCELLIYGAARAQHVSQVIKPALDRGDWVLCDRFTASSVAFQSGGRGIDRADIDLVNQFATSGLKPDLTVFIDIDLEECESRKAQRSLELGVEQDRFETEKRDFHQRVRDSYIAQSEKNDSWAVINGHQSIEDIFSEIIQIFEERNWFS